MKKIAIIGFGHVGRSMYQLFPDAIIYDPNIDPYKSTQERINDECEIAFICVWTGSDEKGACDISLVESSVKWLKTPLIVIKSTVAPGTTDFLRKKYKKRICMSPEFFGEYSYWIPASWGVKDWPYLIVGGDNKDAVEVMYYYIPILGPLKTYFYCSALEAELIKYMENSWFATKVTFVNEVYEICKKMGADWVKVREGWTLDPRIEKSHSAVFPENRGFGGKCLPKDLLALIRVCQKNGYEPKLLKEVLNSNARFRKKV